MLVFILVRFDSFDVNFSSFLESLEFHIFLYLSSPVPLFSNRAFHARRMFFADISSSWKRRYNTRPKNLSSEPYRVAFVGFGCCTIISVYSNLVSSGLHNSRIAKVYRRLSLCECTYANYESVCIDHCCSSPLLK